MQMKPFSISGTVRNIVLHEKRLCSLHLKYVLPAFVSDLHKSPKWSSTDCIFVGVTTVAVVQCRRVRVRARLSAGALRVLVALSELISPVTWPVYAAEPEEAIAWYNKFAISTQKSVELSLSPLPDCLHNVFCLSSVLMTLQVVERCIGE
jgi:hypothetical protein